MRQRLVTVKAENEEAARRIIADDMGTTVDNLLVRDIGGGEFRVQIINADAEVEITIEEDNSKATISNYAPPTGTGKHLTLEILTEQIAQQGVEAGILSAALEDVIDRLHKDHDIKGSIVAMAVEPTPATDAKIEAVGDMRRPYFPGMTICERIPFQRAQSGRDVRGLEIKPPMQRTNPRDIKIQLKDGVEPGPDDNTAIAATYGLLEIRGAIVRIDKAYTVSDDLLEICGDLWATDAAGEEITVERIKTGLARIGYVYGLKEEFVNETLRELREKEKAADQTAEPAVARQIVAMEGKRPYNGKDGRVDILVKSPGAANKNDEDEQVDFHERSTIRNVHAGEPMAVLVPPELGVAGKNIKGEDIPATDGKEIQVQAGANVTVAEDGVTFIPDIDGILVYAKGKISVTDLLEIKGNIDFDTGNIRLEKGSLSVKGSIRTGFTVDVPGNILVGEAIEGAEVHSGADIDVRRGIVMHEKGYISADGSVFAHFSENADIRAEKDVDIANDISNCNIFARGKVLALRGKGKIMGGTIHAGEGIEANELGSEMGVPTEIIVGIEPEGFAELIKVRNDLQENIKKIVKIVGDKDIKTILQNTPPAKRKAVARILKVKISAEDRLKEVENQIEELLEQRKEAAKATVKVFKAINPGVRINIAGEHFRVNKRMQRCLFKYDNNSREIRALPLEG